MKLFLEEKVFFNRRRFLMGAASFCLLTIVIVFAARSATPEDAFEMFLTTTEFSEGELIDPLILQGDDVVPIVLENVKNKELPRRHYAIIFLGNGRYKESLPTLRSILFDSSESNTIRAQTLEAITQIDFSLGLTFAKQHLDAEGQLGLFSNHIVAKLQPVYEQRTLKDVLRPH
ncbi:hypothetical protein Pla110_43260 [Polystyrenella longa]|uniref:HEAT repeat protein n=1 Tax=Polystyrenella longa TaxID=2528007 RepID=A0A518CTL2_9PLAN|nr:hypothetical protein [Polystyrenella longa]QDU82566.1 hypothetical protein Pla110_43260 [Polystyrenella longa]